MDLWIRLSYGPARRQDLPNTVLFHEYPYGLYRRFYSTTSAASQLFFVCLATLVKQDGDEELE